MWGDWGQCSKPCSSGIQERMRVCINSPLFDVCNNVCNGSSIETRECNTHNCPGKSLACTVYKFNFVLVVCLRETPA